MAINFRFIASARENLLLISIFTTLSVNVHPAISGDGGDFGHLPYLEVYPSANLSRSQLDCTPQPADDNGTACPLYIALMMSFGSEYDSSGVIASVQYALDQINDDPYLLPGYSLHYTLTDTQVLKLTTVTYPNNILKLPIV